MKKSTITILVLLMAVAAILISGCSAYTLTAEPQAGGQPQPALPEPPSPPAAASEKSVEITSAGFSPNTLTIKAGDTVTFVNKDAAQHWPASALHPTHAVYPETGGCIASKFDACKGMEQGEEFKFTFSQKGEWKYHDHLNPSLFGTIVVE